MGLDIVRGVITQPSQTNIIIDHAKIYIENNNDNGTLYLGYPLTASSNTKITIDALLITEKRGMITFIYEESSKSSKDLKDEQDALYYHLDFYLKKYGSLRNGRNLAFTPKIITVMVSDRADLSIDNADEYCFVKSDYITGAIKALPEFDKTYFRNLCEALQKVTNIRPQKKRSNVKLGDSRGFIIREIEKEIANLDEWQKKAALEVPDGPQRIRGLAGTGKTIVLALKAAYLHTQYPDWNILITYFTRSLKQQYEELVTKFVEDFSGDKPDWSKLKLMHSWGNNSEEGVYFNLAQKYRAPIHTLTSAINKYGRKNTFRDICEELLSFTQKDIANNEYDAIIIDEAQDLPSPFFRLIYKNIKNPKRIIWAYDELQNLSDMEMPSLEEMFGKDEYGDLLININNVDNEPKRDIILPICYRNPPWTLSMAHALGFGIYNQKRSLPIQTFDNPKLWRDIGYSVSEGRLDYGKKVVIERKNNAAPQYFEKLLNVEDSITFSCFKTKEDQFAWVAQEIEKNITIDELEPDDILVVFPDSYTSKSDYANFQKYLVKHRINSILAGVNSSQDTFKMNDNITCSGIYRAKGNESPMVYIINVEYCNDGIELVKLRNVLFTAITRSRAWVRLCGVDGGCKDLYKEFEKCKSLEFRLSFKVPTKAEMNKIRKLNREKTEEEIETVNKAKINVEELISMVEKGDIDQDLLPELETLINIIKKKKS